MRNVNLMMLAGLVGTIMLAGIALAGPITEPDAALARGDSAKASKLSQLLAANAVGEAQADPGGKSIDGKGVPQDVAEAAQWYRKAADQGDADAQNSLGTRYESGQGVPQDYAEAVKWYRKAADQGNALGQYNLGVLYDDGKGVLQDFAEAVKWYRRAADQGYPDAQNNLGYMYDHGKGVLQDYVEAHKWYNLATARFPAAQAEQRERAAQNRDLLASKMTPAQIADAQGRAQEWNETHLPWPLRMRRWFDRLVGE